MSAIELSAEMKQVELALRNILIKSGLELAYGGEAARYKYANRTVDSVEARLAAAGISRDVMGEVWQGIIEEQGRGHNVYIYVRSEGGEAILLSAWDRGVAILLVDSLTGVIPTRAVGRASMLSNRQLTSAAFSYISGDAATSARAVMQQLLALRLVNLIEVKKQELRSKQGLVDLCAALTSEGYKDLGKQLEPADEDQQPQP